MGAACVHSYGWGTQTVTHKDCYSVLQCCCKLPYSQLGWIALTSTHSSYLNKQSGNAVPFKPQISDCSVTPCYSLR